MTNLRWPMVPVVLGDGRPADHRGAASGFTLIEMIVALAVVVLVIGAVVMSFASVRAARVRKATVQIAGTIRYAYDRARATGKDHRIVFVLGEDSTKYWIEIATEGHVRVGGSVDQSREMRDKRLDGDDEDQDGRTTAGGLDREIAVKHAPKPAWKKYKSRLSIEVTLRRVHISSIYLARLDEEVSEGEVSLYFWGNGQTEKAIIYVKDDEDREYSIVVHPLTGRAKIIRGHYDLPRGGLNQDDEGQEVQDR
ncbi:MAG: prepilin-type N-terminal cleavage/methylation domain-containing protein [Deltaproteobacteria bacterium]|nr:prepilin-type N-terminal cleavage/methylation domain-containing protein [Deltaproteobacteria bacterium]